MEIMCPKNVILVNYVYNAWLDVFGISILLLAQCVWFN